MIHDPLKSHRLDGRTLSAGCRDCPLRSVCGGYYRVGGAWSCMDHCNECDSATCDRVCLKNHTFVRDLAEIQGFELKVGEPLLGLPPGRIPVYVPAIEHASSRSSELEWPVVALPLRHLLKRRGSQYEPVAVSPKALRARFKLASTTKVLVRGTGGDGPLERYWKYGREAGAPAALAKLDLWAAVPPNFSHFLDDPRPTHLANMKRSVAVAADLSQAGLAIVPYLVAIMEHDYTRWETFLREHPAVGVVAEEFGTGLERPDRALPVLDRIRQMQVRLGRPLHLVAISGAQFVQEIAERFEHFSIIDSTPFFKAMHRQMARLSPAGLSWDAMPTEDVSGLLYHNIAIYARHIGSYSRCSRTRHPVHLDPLAR